MIEKINNNSNIIFTNPLEIKNKFTYQFQKDSLSQKENGGCCFGFFEALGRCVKRFFQWLFCIKAPQKPVKQPRTIQHVPTTTTVQQTEPETLQTVCNKITNYVKKHFPRQGAIGKKSGFVYVKISKDKVVELFKKVEKFGFRLPNYFTGPKAAGAHISIILPEEGRACNLPKKIPEMHQTVSFEPLSCQVAEKRTKRLIVLNVEAKELSTIREKYGLGPFPRGYDFHVTIATADK